MQEIFFSPLYNYGTIKKGFPNHLHFVIMLILTVKTNLVNKIEADRINERFPLAPKCGHFMLQNFLCFYLTDC